MTVAANLNAKAAVQVNHTKFDVGGSANLVGVKLSSNGIENVSGNPNSTAGGMSTEGSRPNYDVVGAGVDISGEVKATISGTISVKSAVDMINDVLN